MTAHPVTPRARAAPPEQVVDVADFAVGRDAGVLSTSGLGSCVALVIHDAVARVAGLAHILLPEVIAGSPPSRPAKFAETGVPLLVVAIALCHWWYRRGAQVDYERTFAKTTGPSSFSA